MYVNSNNLNGIFKMYMGKGDIDQCAATTELIRIVSAAGNSAALQQENLRLCAKLYDLE